VATLVVSLAACQRVAGARATSRQPNTTESAFLDTLQARTFQYFWQLSDPRTGLTRDRAPTQSFVSVGATGFALTAYPIGVARGYVSREAARRRVLATLRFLWTAPQDSTSKGASGYRGFYYHFLDPASGTRFEDVELSTMDTALLMGGVLFCQSYFDAPGAGEDSVRALAESLYARVDWKWAQVRPPTIVLGWKPEGGFLPYDWRGYNEAMLLHILALGSPSHAVGTEVWPAWTKGYKWGTFQGYEHLGFAPLFGHQYSHLWIDFRGILDPYMRGHGIDYFENSRRAVLAQRAYAVANAEKWGGYSPVCWGLSACDGPVDGKFEIGGRSREFHTYWDRGASFTWVNDDGTLSPSGVAGSIVFAPEIVLPTLVSLREKYGEHVFAKYGFLDALNPTFQLDVPVHHGKVVPNVGWFDTDYLGIDEGPILGMVENYRSGLVWDTMRRNPHIVRGLRAAGFTGAWLDAAPVTR
jgi:hypothetical protein